MALMGSDGVLRGRRATAERITAFDIQRPEQAAALSAWLVHAPDQGAFWDDYIVSLIHLRSVPGATPPVIRVAGATHEILVAALDPEHRPNAADAASRVILLPLNVELQFLGLDDDAAKAATELLAGAVCDGWLLAEPPLPGDQAAWETALAAILEHRSTRRLGEILLELDHAGIG